CRRASRSWSRSACGEAHEHLFQVGRRELDVENRDPLLAQPRERVLERGAVLQPEGELRTVARQQLGRKSLRQPLAVEPQAQLQAGKGLEEVTRRVERGDTTRLEQRDAVAMQLRFLEVMRDEHDGVPVAI